MAISTTQSLRGSTHSHVFHELFFLPASRAKVIALYVSRYVCIPKFWFSSKIRDLIYLLGVGFLVPVVGKTGVVSIFHCSSYSCGQ